MKHDMLFVYYYWKSKNNDLFFAIHSIEMLGASKSHHWIRRGCHITTTATRKRRVG